MKVAKRIVVWGALVTTATLLISCPANSLLISVQDKVNEAQAGGGTVATPVLSLFPGTYSSDQSVTIKDSTPGSAIHYTTDGSTPSVSTTLYTGPISVAGNGTTMTIKAIGTKAGITDSPLVTATYTVKYSQAITWVPVGSAGFSAGQSGLILLAISSSGTPYVAYEDWSDGYKATVMEYTGAGATGWVPVGSPDFSAGAAYYLSFAISSSGIPCVAYEDPTNSDYATVMEYTGTGTTGWTPVGNPGFSAGMVGCISLAFNNNTPYVAYQDIVNNINKATVMEYTGTGTSGWVIVGSPDFSTKVYTSLNFTSLSLAIDGGTPYVAYEDEDNSETLMVMKYNGAGWAGVGSPDFSAGSADTPVLVINNGIPYVAYEDGGNSNKATLMKYAGPSLTGWVTVGSPGFSAGEAYYTSLAFSSSGTPYVAYSDYGNSEKVTVMEYTGAGTTGWVNVGNAGFSAGPAAPQLAIYNGTPYVAYPDVANGNKATVMQHQ